MSDSKTEVKLLELFDVLSKSFYSLQSNYDKLKVDLDTISKNTQGSFDSKQIIAQIEKDLQITKQASERIEKIVFELQAYKDNIQNVPGQLFEHLHDVTTKLSLLVENLKNHDSSVNDIVKRLNETFNKEFIESVQNIKDVTTLTKELRSLAKFSKLVSKPLGLIVLFISLVISVGATLIGIVQMKDQIKETVNKAIEQVSLSVQQKNAQKNVQPNLPQDISKKEGNS